MYTINSLNLMNEPAGQYILTIELSEEDGGGGGKGEKGGDGEGGGESSHSHGPLRPVVSACLCSRYGRSQLTAVAVMASNQRSGLRKHKRYEVIL